MEGKKADVREMSVRDMIQTLTRGRPWVFLIVSYREEMKDLCDLIAEVTERDFDVACIRADQVPSTGYDLLNKIHQLIDRAELVIAEISELSPNVFYEIGYAVGVQKPPMLLIEKGKDVPTDIRGLEFIEYENRLGGSKVFEQAFRNHLRFRLNSELALLRDMLEAPDPHPSHIVVSPKPPGVHGRTRAQVFEKRTFGDHLGTLGLTSAFGSIWGAGRGVELISAEHSPPDLPDGDMNLYLIGSRKVNTHAGTLLTELQRGREPNWAFDPASQDKKEVEDWKVALYRTTGGVTAPVWGTLGKVGGTTEDVWVEDYGIIVRGPHPRYPNRLVLILAGAHSLGTGAACLAATRSFLIQKVRGKLPQGTLEKKSSTFWVLVKGTARPPDFCLDPDDVEIMEAGVYA